VSAVLVLDDAAAPGGWKALRGAMGSTFRVPVGTGSSSEVLEAARARGVRVAAAVSSGGVAPGPDLQARRLLVLIGSEGAGLPPDVRSAADVRLTVPMRSHVNSLNAATTAAILMWEMTRSRRPDTGTRP
jgi:TrmH family RNA methyltransferase